MGNVTAKIVKRNVRGVARSATVDLTYSNAYATGGDTITAAVLDAISPELKQDTANFDFDTVRPTDDGHRGVFDRTNKKLLLLDKAGTEAANASDQSAVTVRAEIVYGGGTGK